jgi:NAD(P)-dependent dehydrogenase (short-subunit alcohol dehydrogenase family)
VATNNTNSNFRCEFGVADVGKEDDVKKLIYDAWHIFGRIDVFFSNAGILTLGGVAADDVSNEQWGLIWNINVMSHVFAARYLFPLWQQRSSNEDDQSNIGGVFVITASAAGLLMQLGSLPYHVTKHAAVSVADWLAVHHYDEGIRVHCVCPQAVQTNMLKESIAPRGGSAGTDGVLLPRDVAIKTIEAIEKGEFMVLPHQQVKNYHIRKASDYDRWLNGMRRVHRHFFSPSRL